MSCIGMHLDIKAVVGFKFVTFWYVGTLPTRQSRVRSSNFVVDVQLRVFYLDLLIFMTLKV